MLIRRRGEDWRSPQSTHYTNEDELQRLLAESPGLLPDIDPAQVAVARELPISGSGYLDVAVVGLDATITLVECKLQANPEIRRSVVGQVLAYASGLWRTDVLALDAAWAAVSDHGLLDAVRTLADGRADTAFDTDQFQRALAANLAAGRFRLVIAVDTITPELRRIVEFLNDRTVGELQVIALELDLVRDGDYEMLLPTVYGLDVARSKTAQAARSRAGTRADLEAALAEWCPTHVATALTRLLDLTEQQPKFHHYYWGEGQHPSATAVYSTPNGDIQPWSLYSAPNGGTVWAINFDWIYKGGTRVPEDAMRQLRDTLGALPGTRPAVNDAEQRGWRRRPSIPVQPLFDDPTAVDTIVRALQRVLEQSE